MCSCCGQDPTEVNTNPHNPKTQIRTVTVLQMYVNAAILRFISCVSKAITHSVGGWLQCLDMEREGLQQAEKTERTTGMLLGAFGCFPVCGRMAVTTAI